MTTVWTYPWVLADCGLEAELEALAAMGVDRIAVASHYHSVQTIAPRATDSKVHTYPGGCYFTPDSGRFENVGIEPFQNRIPALDDPLAAISSRAKAVGIEVSAWTVCNHNSRLGAAHPDYRTQSAFGEAHDHALCPSWPVVREYLGALVESIAEYGVDRIELESVGFPSALHGHGSSFGHLKNHVLTSPSENVLFSQCFCPGCRRRAVDSSLDIDAAQSRVQELLARSMRSSGKTLPPVGDLTEQYPEIDALFAFRRTVIADLLAVLDDASGSVPLNYYVADGVGRGSTDGRPAGIRLDEMGETVDEVTSLCYTSDPNAAREQTRNIRALFDGPTHAAVTMDPAVSGERGVIEDVATAARDAANGELYIYNHSLLGGDQLDWVADLAVPH